MCFTVNNRPYTWLLGAAAYLLSTSGSISPLPTVDQTETTKSRWRPFGFDVLLINDCRINFNELSADNLRGDNF